MLYAVFYALQAAVAVALPLIFIAKYKKKNEADKRAVWNGVCVYFIFGAVIKSIVALFVTGSLEPSSPFVQNLWLSSGLSALITTVFVVFGKYIWLKAVMKDDKKGSAVLFGSGYALAFLLIGYGISAIMSAVFSVMLALSSGAQISVIFSDTYALVTDSSLYDIFLVILQSILLGVFEVCTSVVLFGAVKKKTHAVFGALAVIFSFAAYFIPFVPLASFELKLIILAVALLLCGWTTAYTYKRI